MSTKNVDQAKANFQRNSDALIYQENQATLPAEKARIQKERIDLGTQYKALYEIAQKADKLETQKEAENDKRRAELRDEADAKQKQQALQAWLQAGGERGAFESAYPEIRQKLLIQITVERLMPDKKPPERIEL